MGYPSTPYPPLNAMQARQLEHDRQYSRDLMGMSVHDRLTHYSLHQYKYVGRLVEFDHRNPKFAFERIVVDAAVVMLATANALKMNLETSLTQKPPLTYTIKTPQALGHTMLQPGAKMASALIEHPQRPSTLWSWLAGQMPKARRAERAFQQNMGDATVTFCRILSGVGMGLNLDLEALHAERIELRARTNLFNPQNLAQMRANSPQ